LAVWLSTTPSLGDTTAASVPTTRTPAAIPSLRQGPGTPVGDSRRCAPLSTPTLAGRATPGPPSTPTRAGQGMRPPRTTLTPGGTSTATARNSLAPAEPGPLHQHPRQVGRADRGRAFVSGRPEVTDDALPRRAAWRRGGRDGGARGRRRGAYRDRRAAA